VIRRCRAAAPAAPATTSGTSTSTRRPTGVCDLDGGELYQRDDDKAETIANRLDVYAESTRRWSLYAGRGLLVGIDATGPGRPT
jgi:adenylate kinase family enzyme